MTEVIIAYTTNDQVVSEVYLVVLGTISLFVIFFVALELIFGGKDRDSHDDDDDFGGGMGILNLSYIPVPSSS